MNRRIACGPSRRTFFRTGTGIFLLAPIGNHAGCDASSAVAIISLVVSLGKLVYNLVESIDGDSTVQNLIDKPLTMDMEVQLRNLSQGVQDEYVVEIDVGARRAVNHQITRLYSQRPGTHVIVTRALGEVAESDCFEIGEGQGACDD
jgi:hypothetical protein